MYACIVVHRQRVMELSLTADYCGASEDAPIVRTSNGSTDMSLADNTTTESSMSTETTIL